jgi:hypothetical protein
MGREALIAGLRRILVWLKHFIALPVAAGLVPATPIILARASTFEFAGTSPVTTAAK